MQSASEIKRTARIAGLLYLAMSILAMASFFYLHRRYFVPGDPAATARSIVANESLYRWNILLDVVTQVIFIFVVLALYRLFRDVDRGQARAMVALVGTGIVASFAGFGLHSAPLLLLGGSAWLSAFTRPQLEAFSYAALGLAGKEGEMLTLLWGLWLLPFGTLTIRSGFFPKFLGVLLYLSGVAYIVTFVVALAFPDFAGVVRKVAMPLYFGEFVVVLWLAIVGARPGLRMLQQPGAADQERARRILAE